MDCKKVGSLSLIFCHHPALVLGIAVFTGVGIAINYLKKSIDYDLAWLWTLLLKISRWLILFFIYFITVGMLYKYGPSQSKYWKIFSPGAMLATILAILAFSGFCFLYQQFQ